MREAEALAALSRRILEEAEPEWVREALIKAAMEVEDCSRETAEVRVEQSLAAVKRIGWAASEVAKKGLK